MKLFDTIRAVASSVAFAASPRGEVSGFFSAVTSNEDTWSKRRADYSTDKLRVESFVSGSMIILTIQPRRPSVRFWGHDRPVMKKYMHEVIKLNPDISHSILWHRHCLVLAVDVSSGPPINQMPVRTDRVPIKEIGCRDYWGRMDA